MRRVVLQMMSTINGRLDKPYEWLDSVGEDHYDAVEERYRSFDTVLVGRTTYDEMVEYWPSALASGEGSAANQRMAQHMHDYRKVAFSHRGDRPLQPWNREEQRVAQNDADLAGIITQLKSEPGKDIHLAGGAALAQSMIALGLVDLIRLYVYPIVSPGESWFGALTARRGFELVERRDFEAGVVEVTYRPKEATKLPEAQRFTELIA